MNFLFNQHITQFCEGKSGPQQSPCAPSRLGSTPPITCWKKAQGVGGRSRRSGGFEIGLSKLIPNQLIQLDESKTYRKLILGSFYVLFYFYLFFLFSMGNNQPSSKR